jgi:hypothetical protein
VRIRVLALKEVDVRATDSCGKSFDHHLPGARQRTCFGAEFDPAGCGGDDRDSIAVEGLKTIGHWCRSASRV